MRSIIYIIVLIALNVSHLSAQDIFLGGKIGYSLPTNIGRTDEELGFNDVADGGVQLAFVGKWLYNKRLSLGYDMGWQYQNGDSDFWDVANRGDVSVSYQTIRFLVDGNYYFSHDEVRPYLGIAFGAYYMINKMDFESSTYTNTSVSYTAKEWKPGIAPQFGILFELSKKAMLDCMLRMDLIAHMETAYINDDNIGLITQNPHGKQNQVTLSVALLFGL